MRRLLVALLVLLPAVAQAQITPLFQSDIRAATSPNFGFDGMDDGDCDGSTTCSWTRLAGVSPRGNDAIRVTLYSAGVNAQPSLFWYSSGSVLPTVTQGNSIFVRWSGRIVAPVNWRSDFGGTNNNSAGGKTFILGNGCGVDAGRMIATWGSDATRLVPYFDIDQNVNGFQVRGDIASGLFDTWVDVQMEFDSSTTDVTTDGALKVWINNNTYASPTDQATGIAIPSSTWGPGGACTGEIHWVFSPFNALGVGGSFVMDFADLVIDDAFDPNWHGGGGGGSSGPYRFRFRVEWLTLPLGLLASVWLLRGRAA